MKQFQFADLHCHPTLKAFGSSFSKRKKRRSNNLMLDSKKPSFFTILFQKLIGITKFSQTDLTTMAEANVRLAFVSLYPFEKGFFWHPYLNNKMVAILANFITSVGYNRIRYIQKHRDYFKDLMNEYYFLLDELKKQKQCEDMSTWKLMSRKDEWTNNGLNRDLFFIIPTIEGAHVFNTGLTQFGKKINKVAILNNINKLKALPFPPLFITLTHNFNNDLCGHAPSLQPLATVIDQSNNLNQGISLLGYDVINRLLKPDNGYPIYIDIKHMSVTSRKEYYRLLEIKYDNSIPIIVSHGAVIGTDYNGKRGSSVNPTYFSPETINFYDEELLKIAQTKGLFAIQFDAKRLAPKRAIKKPLFSNNKVLDLKKSTLIIWNQLRHIAEVLDANGYYSWKNACIGSDFDGTINPLNGIWTSLDFNDMANELLVLVIDYLSNENQLRQKRNYLEDPLVVVKKFTYDNTKNFVLNFYCNHQVFEDSHYNDVMSPI